MSKDLPIQFCDFFFAILWMFMVSFGCCAHPLRPFDGRAVQSNTPLHLCIFDYIWDLNSLACTTLHFSYIFYAIFVKSNLTPFYISAISITFGNWTHWHAILYYGTVFLHFSCNFLQSSLRLLYIFTNSIIIGIWSHEINFFY